jgi:hypothetical protein
MNKFNQVKIPILINSETGEVIPDIPYKYTLTRLGDGLVKKGNKLNWVEWDKDGRFKESHKEIDINRSLVLDWGGFNFSWQTTEVVNIKENTSKLILFSTTNSDYKLEINEN